MPYNEAKLPLAMHSLQYGTTCFTGIRGYYRDKGLLIFRLKDHWQRLVNNVKIAGIPFTLDWDFFQDTIIGLIKLNNPTHDIYIRPFLFAENEALSPRFDGLDYQLAVYVMEMGDYYDTTRGMKLITSTWKKNSNASIPSKAKLGGAYVNAALATTEAHRLGCDDALMMNELNEVVEASVANIAIVYKGEVLMPDIGEEQLEGITRDTIISFLQEENIPFRYGPIDRSLVYTCDELLLLGTASQVIFTYSIDGRVINSENKPGKICQILRDKFKKLIDEGKSPWLTRVDLL